LLTNSVQPTKLCIGGRYVERSNTVLETILESIGEAAKELDQREGVNI
jgi:hypothetical protein